MFIIFQRVSTSAGVMWLVGRIWYAKAYAEGRFSNMPSLCLRI